MRLLLGSAHVLQMNAFGALEYKDAEGPAGNVFVIISDVKNTCNLHDFVQHSESRFSELLARYFFVQILQAVSEVHSKQVVHRDIKLENLLLDQKYNLSLADFGFATSSLGKKGDSRLSTRLGTPGYMAPEVVAGEFYNGEKADLFSVGVCLFLLAGRRFPFMGDASPTDPMYSLIKQGKYKEFWEAHALDLSPELCNLLESLWHFEPEKRLSLE